MLKLRMPHDGAGHQRSEAPCQDVMFLTKTFSDVFVL